jgi:hypothetical protein
MTRKGMDRFTQETTATGNRHDPFWAQPRTDDSPVRQFVDMRVLELLTSRLCHELSA